MKQMKNIILTLSMLAASFFSAQVIIGDEIGTAAVKNSVLLEFANTGNKGIVLPYVTMLPSFPSEGTIILDATVPTEARVKYYNGSWVDLSGQDFDISTELFLQPVTTEEPDSKVIIGDETSVAKGVLVLESANKAMVLPTVSSTNEIANPSPGMMVYVKGDNKRLAVFNGSKWSFWRP